MVNITVNRSTASLGVLQAKLAVLQVGGRTAIFNRLSDLALLEEARARLDFDDETLLRELGGLEENTFSHWRRAKGVPGKHRAVLLKIVTDRLTTDEKERQRVAERLDEILEKVKGIEEVRGLVQRALGPPPAADKRRRAG